MENMDLIEDLQKKLSLYKQSRAPRESEGVKGRDYAKVAELLANSTPFPFELNRNNISELMSGKCDWPLTNGGTITIPVSFDLEVLESIFLVRFVNGTLRINPTPDPSDNYSENCNQLLDAMAFLTNAAWGDNDYERPGVVYEKSLPEGLSDIFEELQCGKQRISIPPEEIRPVGTHLWMYLVRKRKSSKEALKKWLHLMEAAFEFDFPFDLEFYGTDEKEKFLDAAVALLLEEEDLQDDWKDESRKLFMEERRHRDSIWGSHSIHMRVSIGDGVEGSPNPMESSFEPAAKVDLNRLDALCLQGVSTPVNTPVSNFLWWQESPYFKGFSHTSRTCRFLVYMIVENEPLNVHSQSNFTRLCKLLDACENRMGLAGLLFNQSLPLPLAPCFLSISQYSSIGLLEVAMTTEGPGPRLESGGKNCRQEWMVGLWHQAADIMFVTQGEEELNESCIQILDCLAKVTFSNKKISIEFPQPILSDFLAHLEDVRIGGRSYLFSFLPELVETLAEDLKHQKTFSRFPLAEIYLLFWALEKSSRLGHSGLKEKISASITSSYRRSIITASEGAFSIYSSDKINALVWPMVFKFSGSPQQKALINTFEEFVAMPDVNARSKLFSAMRVHIHVLIECLSERHSQDDPNSGAIQKELFRLSSTFGFSDYGVFSPAGDEGSGLWRKFVTCLNLFDDNYFSLMIQYLRSQQLPPSILLILESGLISEDRRRQVKSLVGAQKFDHDLFSWWPDIQMTVMLASNSGRQEYAEKLICEYEAKVPAHMKSGWLLLSGKVKLHGIFEDTEKELDEKLQEIDRFSVSQQLKDANSWDSRGMASELERHKRFLRALLYYETDPKRTYQCLDDLCNQEANPLYSYNRLAAKIKVLDESEKEASREELQDAVLEWESSIQDIESHKITQMEAQVIFQILNETEDYKRFDDWWERLDPELSIQPLLAKYRCEAFLKENRLDEAQAFLEAVKKHNVYADTDTEKLMGEIANQLRFGLIKKHDIELTASFQDDPVLTSRRAREVWNEICRFGHHKQSSIFTNGDDTDHPAFCQEILSSVCLELLDRGKNIEQLDAGKMTLQLEDIVNDWMTSLFRKKVEMLNWGVRDQTRGGTAASGKGVGERDGVVCNSNSVPIALIEAFRLTSLNKNYISTHIEKLSGYNALGMEDVFVVVYCYLNNFNKLCDDYLEYLNSLSYTGFDPSAKMNVDDRFSEVKKSPNLRVYREERKVNGMPVRLFHYLLDFKKT